MPIDGEDEGCVYTPARTKRELIAIEKKIAARLNIYGPTVETLRESLIAHYRRDDVAEDDHYQDWMGLLASHREDIRWADAHPEEKVNFDEPE